jgi:hypothetical protein
MLDKNHHQDLTINNKVYRIKIKKL